MKAQGKKKPVIRIPIFGKTGSALRAGAVICKEENPEGKSREFMSEV